MNCTIGQEVDPYTRRPRWLIKEKDPCQCTEIRRGCFNTFLPRRPFKVTYYDTYLVSSDPVEIRLWLNCTGKSHHILYIVKQVGLTSGPAWPEYRLPNKLVLKHQSLGELSPRGD